MPALPLLASGTDYPSDHTSYADIRPLVWLNVAIVVEQNGRMETGRAGQRTVGVRPLSDDVLWQAEVNEALRIALLNLDLVFPGRRDGNRPGAMAGVMLHEAVGHGLEGDFNRKGTSVFSGRTGEQVAAKGELLWMMAP